MTSPDAVPAAPATSAVPASGHGYEPAVRPPAGADPFAPDGVVFHPVSHRLITARILGVGLLCAVLVIGFVIPGVLFSSGFFIPAALAPILFIWQLWLIPRQVRAMGYASASTDATINGLPVAEAENLRQVLSQRGEERMAGL